MTAVILLLMLKMKNKKNLKSSKKGDIMVSRIDTCVKVINNEER